MAFWLYMTKLINELGIFCELAASVKDYEPEFKS